MWKIVISWCFICTSLITNMNSLSKYEWVRYTLWSLRCSFILYSFTPTAYIVLFLGCASSSVLKKLFLITLSYEFQNIVHTYRNLLRLIRFLKHCLYHCTPTLEKSEYMHKQTKYKSTKFSKSQVSTTHSFKNLYLRVTKW